MQNPMTTDERRGATSASNAEADLNCPGRHLAQAGLPDTSSEYAEGGTSVHDALAANDPANLTPEQRETYDRCLELQARLVTDFFGEADAAKAKAWSEDPANPDASRIWIRFKVGDREYEHSCRPDRFWRLGNRALILEWKTLYGDVPVSARNLQLRDQQVLIRGHFLIPGEIGVAVIQPNVTMKPEVCVYTPQDSQTAYRQMCARIIASNDPASPRVPGEVQCRYCKARNGGRCLEYQRYAGAMVPGMLNLLDVPASAWTPEQRAMFMDRASVAQKWLDECRQAIKDGLEKDPLFAPGWGLHPGNVLKEITNALLAFERFAALGGTREQFLDCVKVGRTRLKTAIGEVTGTKGKALDTALAQLCEGIVTEKQTAAWIVRLQEGGK